MAKKKTQQPELPDDALDNIPRASITLTREAIYLTRYNAAGKPAITYPVRASDVAEAFNEFGASTGLLAENTLFWQTQAGQTCIGIYIRPAVYTLHLAGDRRRTLKVSLPGLVFAGAGTTYRLLVSPKRPTSADDMLYCMPLPNTHPDGNICWGNVKIPVCAPNTIHAAFKLFIESEFNNHLTAGKLQKKDVELLAYLRNLNGRRVPIKDLREAGLVKHLMQAMGGRNDAA